jgi:hypothetical protein
MLGASDDSGRQWALILYMAEIFAFFPIVEDIFHVGLGEQITKQHTDQ